MPSIWHCNNPDMLEISMVMVLSSTAYWLLPSHQIKPEDHWSCIAPLSAEDMLKSAGLEEKKFKILNLSDLHKVINDLEL